MQKIIVILMLILWGFSTLTSKTFKLDNIKNFALARVKDNLYEQQYILAFNDVEKVNKKELLSSDKISIKNSKKRGIFYVNVTPVILPGLSLGYGKLSRDKKDKNYYEKIFFLRAHLLGGGFGILINRFKNSQRKGFYYSFKVGLDYVAKLNDVLPLEPGGPTIDKIHMNPFPNFAFGAGYSIKMYKSLYMRLSWDIGIKYLLSNINVSFIF